MHKTNENKLDNLLNILRPKAMVDFVCTLETRMKLLSILEKPFAYRSYLFYGPAGIGKTSFARIFASNLDDKKYVEYFEYNCADTRGIDFARDLLSVMMSMPLLHKYKVIVLDEVHMLTQQAQNTLLKGVEDLPINNFVILCSTDPSSIITTLRSRCYNIDLTPDNLSDIELISSLKKYTKSILEYIGVWKEEYVNVCNDIVNTFIKMNVKNNFSIRQYIPYVYDIGTMISCVEADGNNVTSDAINSFAKSVMKNMSNDNDPVLIARSLLKNKTFSLESKKELYNIVNNNSNIESCRLLILSYATKVLLSSNDDDQHNRATIVIKNMLFDGKTSDAKYKMIIAINNVCNSIDIRNAVSHSA